MAIITVEGPIEPDQLGHTLPHEHIFCDTSGDYREPPPHIRSLLADMDVDLEAPISLRSLGFLRREPQWSIDNQRLESYEDARDELALAMRAGIRAVVDCTPIGLGRKPEASRRLARELGLRIVGATGYYRHAFHPPSVEGMSVEAIERQLLLEVTEGMDGTDVRAGLIGELGTTADTITPREERVLVAAGRVQRLTNVPVYVHTEGRLEIVLRAIGILVAQGADPARIQICHVNEAPWWPEVLATGASIGLDCFGSTFSIDSETRMNPNDQVRIDALKRIFDAGHGDRVLVSNDICMKMRLHRCGGWGYDHIQTNLWPFLRQSGFGDADLELLFIENPRQVLDTGRP
jgi:phosphotriesterase-related protein